MDQPTNTPAPQQPVSSGAPSPADNQTVMGVIAYIIFFVPLLTDSKKDPFVKYHVKQGLSLFILGAAIYVVRLILPWQIEWQLGWLFWLLNLAVLALLVLGIVNVVNKKQAPLPVIGKIGDMFKF